MTIPPPHSMQPSHIGHYEIHEPLGRGGMGLVYLARDPRLDRQVAIKCLRAELYEHNYRERFKREALLLAKLNHPHIVQIYDFIESEDQLALVMEYVDGQNLQLRLREHIVPIVQRMQWLTQIAQGLAIAHDAGIIHRDLKTENILINKRNDAKISDLGIAKSQDFNATVTDYVTGSYTSMSPEQAMGEELNFKSDLFSFGILAYQLLCGAHPFGDSNNKLQLMQRIISHPPTPPTKHNPNLPPEICNLLGQLLSKNIENRPTSTHWVAEQLEQLTHLVTQTPFDSDDTLALPENQASNYSDSIRKKIVTQEHATFRGAVTKPGYLIRTKEFLVANKSVVAIASLALLIGIGVAIWQLQPKQPKYVAVLPPNLTTTEMPESQQELVKGAVYDAIQQSVLQLDGFYLIPRNEITDINASNNKDGLETVRRATAADELITTDIQCKIEACTITLSRLTPEGKKQESRLRVQDTKTVDVLTDNYLSVATIIIANIGSLYYESVTNSLTNINPDDYTSFLRTNQKYRTYGASTEISDELDKLQNNIKTLQAVQTLYSENTLELYHETKDPVLLKKVDNFISLSQEKNSNTAYLTNLLNLKIEQDNLNEANAILEKIQHLNINNSLANELNAYVMMSKKDYQSAVKFYKKTLSSKKTATALFQISIAYWYSGNLEEAKKSLSEALSLSPNYYNALAFYGTIALLDGNVSEAIKAFELIYTKTPKNIMNLSNLGVSYLLDKKFDRALSLFNTALELAPQNSTIMLNKADSENLLGQKELAKRSYQAIIDAQGSQKDSEYVKNISQAYAHLNQYADALAMLKKLEYLDPQNIETTYTAALIHTLAKNNASAILSIDEALKNGMNKIWFSFDWFESLCKESSFIELMQNHGEPNRCSSP